MKEVKAYQCEHCGKLFKTAKHHTLCKSDPDIIHCGDCKNHYEEHDPDGCMVSPHCCKYRLIKNGVPRKKECEKFEDLYRLYSVNSVDLDETVINWEDIDFGGSK